MTKNIEELQDWTDGALREFESEADRLSERLEQINGYAKAMSITRDIISEIKDRDRTIERQQSEIDALSEDVEAKQQEIDELNNELERRQAEIERLQLQQQLAEADAKPTEIHNHFEHGSSAQVFNDKVTGKISKIKKWKQKEKREKRKAW